MGYIKASLMHGENLVRTARIHPFIFVQPAVILLLGWWYSGSEIGLFRYLGWLLLLLGLVALLQRLFVVIGADYGVTDRRLVFKTGIVRRRVRELVHEKIEGIEIYQSFWGRIMGYGSLLVTTGGAINTYTYVRDPVYFRVSVYESIENSRLRLITRHFGYEAKPSEE